MRFALVNTKGGVGKTTTAVHLATMLSRKGPTLLIDNDHPQLSAATWAAWRRENGVEGPSPTTTCLAGRAVATEGRALSENYEHTVVDVGGRDSGGLRAALMLAQRAIVPIGLSAIDSAALTDLLEIIA